MNKTKKIQASDAKARLPQLLDEVEQGVTVVITRHGRAIARLIPEEGGRLNDVEKAVEEIRAIGRRNGPASIEEILSMRDEGRKAR